MPYLSTTKYNALNDGFAPDSTSGDTRRVFEGAPYGRERDYSVMYQGWKDKYLNAIMAIPEWLSGQMAPEVYTPGVIASTPKGRIRAAQMHREQQIDQRVKDLGRDYVEGGYIGDATEFLFNPFIDIPLLGLGKLAKLGKLGRAKPRNALQGLVSSEVGAVGDIAYHGTDANVRAFDPAKYGTSTGAKSAKSGTWVVSDPDTAYGYANYAAQNRPVMEKLKEADAYEKIGDWDGYDRSLLEAEELEAAIYNQPYRGQNIMPLRYKGEYKTVDMAGAEFMDEQDKINSMISEAKRKGKDGVIFKNLADDVGFNSRPAEHTIVFDPKNIESAIK